MPQFTIKQRNQKRAAHFSIASGFGLKMRGLHTIRSVKGECCYSNRGVATAVGDEDIGEGTAGDGVQLRVADQTLHEWLLQRLS